MAVSFNPTETKFCFVFNPCSGHNARNPHLRDVALRFLRDHGLKGKVVLTQHPRHATELAQQAIANGYGVIVAMGGDGTLNEVATAVTDSSAMLGLIPCGSGNGLGRHLGLRGSVTDAFAHLLTGRVRAIDSGTANGLPFFNVMGIGFDAAISSRFNQLTQRGFFAYVRTGLRTWQTYQPETYAIRNGVSALDLPAFVIAVANSDQYGNDCYIAPGAEVDDGQLNLTAIKPFGNLSLVPLAARLFGKSIGRSRFTEQLVGSHFEIHRTAAGPIHTDGEVHDTDAVVTVTVKPRSLRVVVPA